MIKFICNHCLNEFKARKEIEEAEKNNKYPFTLKYYCCCCATTPNFAMFASNSEWLENYKLDYQLTYKPLRTRIL
jgi:hypothetical protein